MANPYPPLRDVSRGISRYSLAAILIVVLAGGLFLGLWRAHLWLWQQNVNFQNHVIRTGQAYQSTLAQEFANDLATVDGITVQLKTAGPGQVPALRAQRLAVANQACTAASQITPAYGLPPQEAAWVRANCAGGVVSPGSSLWKGSS